MILSGIASLRKKISEIETSGGLQGNSTTVGPNAEYPTVRDAYNAGKNNILVTENVAEVGTEAILITPDKPKLIITLAPFVIWDTSNFTGTVLKIQDDTFNSFVHIECNFESKIIYKPTITFSAFIRCALGSASSTFSRGNFNIDLTGIAVDGVSIFRELGTITSYGLTNVYLPNRDRVGLRYVEINTLIEENANITFYGGGSDCSNCIDYTSTTTTLNLNSSISFIGTFSSTQHLFAIANLQVKKGIFLKTTNNTIIHLGGAIDGLVSERGACNVKILAANTVLSDTDLNNGTLDVNNQNGFLGYGIKKYSNLINITDNSVINVPQVATEERNGLISAVRILEISYKNAEVEVNSNINPTYTMLFYERLFKVVAQTVPCTITMKALNSHPSDPDFFYFEDGGKKISEFVEVITDPANGANVEVVPSPVDVGAKFFETFLQDQASINQPKDKIVLTAGNVRTIFFKKNYTVNGVTYPVAYIVQ